MEMIRQDGGGLFRPGNLARFWNAWRGYLRVQLKLSIYETWLSLRRFWREMSEA